jgi:hypothetical protein
MINARLEARHSLFKVAFKDEPPNEGKFRSDASNRAIHSIEFLTGELLLHMSKKGNLTELHPWNVPDQERSGASVMHFFSIRVQIFQFMRAD